MDVISFVITVIVLSMSGALAPGPLFFVTITHGIKSGTKSGVTFAVAHTIIEFSVVMLLAIGLLSVANEAAVRLGIGVAGGFALIIFGVMQIYNIIYQSNQLKTEKSSTKNLFLIGLALTGLNPYFVIWWLTVGANLIFLSLDFAGLLGVIFMYICHVWIDYAWLTFIASFAKKSAIFIRFKWYRFIIVIFGLFLVFFGFSFLFNAFTF